MNQEEIKAFKNIDNHHKDFHYHFPMLQSKLDAKNLTLGIVLPSAVDNDALSGFSQL